MKEKSKKSFYSTFTGMLAAGLLILAVSCTGDQDFADPNNVSTDSDFISVQSLVTGMEAGMRENLDTYYRVVGSIGREIYYFQGADPRFTGELIEGSLDPSGFMTVRPWEARYRVIRTGNTLMETIPRLNLSAGQVAGAEGWTKTIQAYQFLLNLNYTYTKGIIIDVAGATPGPFVSLEASFEFISNLLDEGHAQLTGSGAEFNFSVTDGFAPFDSPAEFAKFNRAIKARVETYRGDSAAVLTALAGSFLVLDEGQLDLGAYHNYSTGAGDLLNPVFENQASLSIVLHGHPDIQTDAQPGDLRFDRKLLIRDITDSFDFLSSNLGVVTATGNSDPLPIIRNEELILLRAEANILLGDLAAAEADINFIREHSGGLGPVSLTDGNAIDLLLYERRYSLYHEGHRWVDMRRFGRLGELPLDRMAEDKVGVEDRGDDVVHEEMPIPSTESTN